jgi:hypothetical protein
MKILQRRFTFLVDRQRRSATLLARSERGGKEAVDLTSAGVAEEVKDLQRNFNFTVDQFGRLASLLARFERSGGSERHGRNGKPRRR